MSKARCPHCEKWIIIQVDRRGDKEMVQLTAPPPVQQIHITADDSFRSEEHGG